MSTVQAFFKQRQKDQSSGKSSAETIAALRGDNSQPTFQYAHVAIQGCCHGELTRIYDACAAHEAETGKRIDFLICCGDFQAIRNRGDLPSMAVPDKYKVLGDFPQYCAVDSAGAPRKTAPYLTLFVGGNHENSDWLAEESYGGYLAPNIYYLGHSGVVEVELPIVPPSSPPTSSSSPTPPTETAETKRESAVVVVGGLSGIFKGNDYKRPYPARPYASSENGKRSAYHVRQIEQEKLEAFVATVARDRHAQHLDAHADPASAAASVPRLPMEAPLIDIVVSHDWPVGITKLGDEEQLIRYKPFFKDDIAHNALGNPHTLPFLRAARPRYWIAAHLHCFFTAQVPVVLPPAQRLGRSSSSEPGDAVTTPAATAFIALDKCAKGKGFLDFVDVPLHWSEASSSPPPSSATAFPRVRRHPAWVEILRCAHPFVAQNAVGVEGFMAAGTADELHTRHRQAGSPVWPSSAALYAPNTAALLEALQLDPALPLQGTSSTESDGPRGAHAERQGPPFRPPWRTHGLDRPLPAGANAPSRLLPYDQPRQPYNEARQPYIQPQQPQQRRPDGPPQPSQVTTAPAPAPPEDSGFTDVGDSPWVVDLGSGAS